MAEAGKRLQEAQAKEIETLRADWRQFEDLADSYEEDAKEAKRRAWMRNCSGITGSRSSNDYRVPWPTGAFPRVWTASASCHQRFESEVANYGEVEGARRREFKIGPMFIEKLNAQGSKYRAKVVKACADVAINAPGLLRRRDDHALRSGEGANDPLVSEIAYEADAHRCCVEQNTASARRLHSGCSRTGP